MMTLLMRARDANYVAAFTVHEPPNPPADRIDRAEALVFVPDGFSWGAALMGPFWLATQQQWVALAAYVAAAAILCWGLTDLGVSEAAVIVSLLAINIWLGFEAPEIKRATLAAEGWRDAGSVSGRDLGECERRFFDGWLAGEPLIARSGTDGTFAPEFASPPSQVAASNRAAQGLLRRLFPART